ncbi:MAG: glycoside hydrolase family 78 protein [Clostridiales bacterium]|nr:glycoside hydrolase family 78 protein [Clostridiales bacterium]
MTEIFKNAKFITTDFTQYFSSGNSPWGQARPPYYQHNDLVRWKGLPMFTKDFEVDNTDGAVMAFTALGCVEIFINGKKIGNDEMKPGWSDYHKRALFLEYDVSSYLVNGKNRILAVVSPGWYIGRIAGGWYGDGTPAVMIAVKGKNEIIATDETWLSTVGGQIRTADIWDGEYRDACEDDYTVLSQPGYELKDWENASITEYKGVVTPFVGTTVRVREGLDRAPETVTVFDGIEYNGSDFGKIHVSLETDKLPVKVLRGQKVVIDLGQEIVGRLKIKVKAAQGVTIKMRYAEFLNDSGLISRGNDGPQGSVYTINLRSALGKAYYVTTDGEQTYVPSFTFFGFRFVELSADGEVEYLEMTGEVVGNDNRETGSIVTSHKLVNKLFSNALWGQRGNYLSVPTDCPQRDERLGWTGDAQAFSVTAAYNADVYGFFRKWMQDMRDSQGENGSYGDVNPRVGCCHSDDACAWADAGIIIPYNLYKIYGDDTMIKEHFDSMEKYIAGILDRNGLSGPIPRYGDWLAYDWCDNKFMSSAYFVHDLDMMAYMCTVAGREDRRDYYLDLRKKAHGYFMDNFTCDGVLKGTTQSEKVMCLAFNLIDDEKYAKQLADELEQQIKDNGGRLSTGFLGTYNLCPALSRYGKSETAYTLLMQRNEPSWLYSIDQGATTIWERWNSYTKEKGFGDVGMNSFNHYAYGSIVEWMYMYMAGIKPLEPGFAKIGLAPVIDTRRDEDIPEGQERMTFVKASFDSPKGLIKSEWSTENGFEYYCLVPQGGKAELRLPKFAGASSLTVNGNAVVKEDDGEVCVFDLEGGEYSFIQR